MAAESYLWLKRVNDLPPFSPVVQEAMDLLNDERSNAEEVALALSRDEAITAKILSTVNSAFYGVRGKVSTVSHAVAILGYDQLRMLMMGVALFEQGHARDPLVRRNRGRIWAHSATSSRWGQELARATRYVSVEEAAVAALLHDVGKIVLGNAAPREFASTLAMSDREGVPSCEAEERAVGISHVEVGAMVAEKWRFPSRLRQAIALHHAPWPPALAPDEPDPARVRHLLAVVCVANWAARESASEASSDPSSPFTVAITPEELVHRLHQMDDLLS